MKSETETGSSVSNELPTNFTSTKKMRDIPEFLRLPLEIVSLYLCLVYVYFTKSTSFSYPALLTAWATN
jgi:hypothetical protein